MNEYPNAVKKTLMDLINEMSESPASFVKNPEKDFTRDRKLPFAAVMQLLISMGGSSINKELMQAHGFDINTATTSAFVQQREKILPRAFEFLLNKFTEAFRDTKTYRGYRLFAVDGSDILIPTDPNDPDTYYRNTTAGKGYCMLHLNALYDLSSRLYIDAIVQGAKVQNENRALTDMVDRLAIRGNAIFLADRNFESYNSFAHIERRGWNYVIRVKDLHSNGILSGLRFPDTPEFDVCMQRILIRRRTKETNAHPELYRFLPPNSSFDFLDSHTNTSHPISLRIVRFKISHNSFETVITNLPQSDFSPTELKALYNMRWGIETSFRDLKYAVGLVHFHAKKRGHILQEVFARIIMYNFAEMITSHVLISKKNTRYLYRVNFSFAIHICRHFLRLLCNVSPPPVEALIAKCILPVRPDRKAERIIRTKKAASFLYRLA